MNNLEKVNKSLKSIVKRCKTVSYSTSLALLFAMLGVSAFSEEIAIVSKTAMKNSKIKAKASELNQTLNVIRAKNNKKLEGSRLELVKLMEQGDHIVKSPWNSWQFGINFFYGRNSSQYRGRNDKEITGIIKRDTSLKRYTYDAYTPNDMPEKWNSKSGNVRLKIIDEPYTEIPIRISIKPKTANVETPSFSLPDNLGGLPLYESIPIGYPANFIPREVSIEQVEPPEILPVEFQMPPVYKEGFAKKYHHYYVANPNGRNSHKTTYENARDITRVNLDENGEALENDVNKQVTKYIIFTHNGITKNGDKPRTELVKDQVIERYAHHYGNLITQLDLTEGTYDLLFKGFHTKASPANRDNYGFGFKVTNGKFSNSTDAGEREFPENYEGHLYTESFYRSSGRAENIIGEKVTVNVVGQFNTNEEHKKYLVGLKPPKTEKKEPALNSVYYLSNPTVKKSTHIVTKTRNKNSVGTKLEINELNLNTVSTLIHRGTTNIYGNKVAIVNIDNVGSRFDTTFKNEGTIIGHNERGSFSTNVRISDDKKNEIRVDTPIITEGNEASHHVFGVFTYGDGGEDTIHNAKTGKVLLKAPKSLGIVYNSGNTQDIDRHFINDGEFKLYGEGSSGIVFNHKSSSMSRVQASYANIQLNEPLEILGDNSFGANISVEPVEGHRKQLVLFKNVSSSNGGVDDKLTKEYIASINAEKLETMEDYKEHFLDKKDGKYYYKATGEEVEGNFDDSTKANIANLNFKDLKGRDVEVKEISRVNTKYYFYREGSDEKTKFTVLSRERDKITLYQYVNSLIEEEKVPKRNEKGELVNIIGEKVEDITKAAMVPTGKHIHKGTKEYVDKASFRDISEEYIKTLVFKDLEGNIIKPDISTSSDTMYSFSIKEITKHLENSKFNIKVGGARAAHSAAESGNKTGGDPNFVENSIGLNFDYQVGTDKTEPLFNKSSGIMPSYGNYQIELGETAKNSVAVRVANASIELTENENSFIKLSGENNVGLLADGKFSDEVVKYKTGGGTIPIREFHFINSKNNIEENGKNNILFASINGSKLKIKEELNLNKEKVKGTGLTIAFVQGNEAKVDIEKRLRGEVASEDAVAFVAQENGTIKIANKGDDGADITNTFPTEKEGRIKNEDFAAPQFVLSGVKNTAFYAAAGGKIEAKDSHIKITDGKVGVFSKDQDSEIDLRKAIIDYSGNRTYSVFTEDNGKIKLEGTKIILRGSSIGIRGEDIDKVDKDADTTFVIMSNDATPFTIGEVDKINLSTIDTDLNTGGIKVVTGEENGEIYSDYIKAIVPKVKNEYLIDVDVNKKLATDVANENTDSYKFVKRYKVQKAKLKLASGKNVTAHLSNDDLEKIKATTVVGLEMNSTESPQNSTQETKIILDENSSVSVDRRTEGTGGIGLYINYGEIETAASSKIEVEKQTDNAANDKAVGIFAVNGSKVDNKAKIDVGGNASIGILGLAYREVNGVAKVNEFGETAAGQGEISLKNAGAINLIGKNALGIFVKNNNANADNSKSKAENLTGGHITISGDEAVGIMASKATVKNNSKISISGQGSLGIYGINGSVLTNEAGSLIELTNENPEKSNIGIYTDDEATTIRNSGQIIGKDKDYGIHGAKITLENTGKITVGNKGVGVSSFAKDVDLQAGSEINVGDGGTAVYISGDSQTERNITGNTALTMGDNAYGYLIKGKKSTLTSNGSPVTLKNNSVFIYSDVVSENNMPNIINNTKVSSTGNSNYGIYSAGKVQNTADIDFSSGVGNIAFYAFNGGEITHGTQGGNSKPVIKVGASDSDNDAYSVGMAAGNQTENGKTTGTVINYGDIVVEKEGGIGMLATGKGSKAINRGNINLKGAKSIGMYLSDEAIGENYGTIETVAGAGGEIIGVSTSEGAIFKNYGTLRILGAGNYTISNFKGESENSGTITGTEKKTEPKATTKNIGKKEIYAPLGEAAGEFRIKIKDENGQDKELPLTYLDTTEPIPNPEFIEISKKLKGKITGDIETIKLEDLNLAKHESRARVGDIGMYIDTSGVNYTKPIEGLENLKGLDELNLIFGVEATRYTNATELEIGDNILNPYNEALKKFYKANKKDLDVKLRAANLTWFSTVTYDQNEHDLKKAYLVKIPYTEFVRDGDTDVYNFADGLEQRYGVEGLNSREKKLFEKLNGIGKGEGILLAQAYDEMMGRQYANTQQRVHSTGLILDKEFKYLKEEWRNVSKSSNKIKVFGMGGEYQTKTAGVVDYDSKAQGLAYMREKEALRLGESSGWYAGLVQNTFKFKDIGKSKEEMLQTKLGAFKSISFDENNSLNNTTYGEFFLGYSKMDRRYLVVDEIFGAKSKYWSYGFALRNQLTKDFRLTETTNFKLYGSLKTEYGKVDKIIEKTGEVRLELKSNDYLSIQPELGVQLGHKYRFGKYFLDTKLNIAYENELGKLADGKNKAKVAYTNADWFGIRGEKENRTGNIKTDLSIGLDNKRFGITANLGYDTKGSNKRLGLGLRVIF